MFEWCREISIFFFSNKRETKYIGRFLIFFYSILLKIGFKTKNKLFTNNNNNGKLFSLSLFFSLFLN